MAKRRTAPIDHSKVIGYIRVSTQDQAGSGLGMQAQRAALEAECDRRGWHLVAVHEDAGLSGKSADRPGLRAAVDDIRSGRGGTLMASKLDRLSRSMKDFGFLMEHAQKGRWNLCVLDVALDLSTPQGELCASIMASTSRWERRIIGQRTADALGALKAQGKQLGRPSALNEDAVTFIAERRLEGESWSAIARDLTEERIPTATGKANWHPNGVRQAALSRGIR
jgi:DNA invertase Pin-like site-specific DNA recombinase